jgi:hypothetical protein
LYQPSSYVYAGVASGTRKVFLEHLNSAEYGHTPANWHYASVEAACENLHNPPPRKCHAGGGLAARLAPEQDGTAVDARVSTRL